MVTLGRRLNSPWLSGVHWWYWWLSGGSKTDTGWMDDCTDLVMLSAVLATVSRTFWSAKEQRSWSRLRGCWQGCSAHHLCKRWLGRMRWSALITHQWKWRSHCAFLIMEMVLVDHVRSSVIFTLKNFVVFTNSTAMPLMAGGMCFFLKSWSYFFGYVDLMLYIDYWCHTSWWVDVPPLCRLSITVVSSVNMMMCFELWLTQFMCNQYEQQRS